MRSERLEGNVENVVRARVSPLEVELDRLYELRQRGTSDLTSVEMKIAMVREAILAMSGDPRKDLSRTWDGRPQRGLEGPELRST